MRGYLGPLRFGRLAAVLLALLGASWLGSASSPADASSSIEGVWSFKGGDIAVQPSGEGAYVGTVVTETRFAQCAHPVGQVIWTGIRPQPDGSYWGFHQWYFESAACFLNPTLGPTAWRVMEGAGATHYLRICLSSPGTSQPMIESDGEAIDATYGCLNSAPASPGVASFKLVSLPANQQCLSQRRFEVHIRDPRADAFKSVLITLQRRRLAVARHRNYSVATVSLVGLPRGTYTLYIRATTFLGQRLSGSRTYHTCVPKKSPGKQSNPFLAGT